MTSNGKSGLLLTSCEGPENPTNLKVLLLLLANELGDRFCAFLVTIFTSQLFGSRVFVGEPGCARLLP